MNTTAPHERAHDTHAVILAAGLGSRLRENTTACPKCLVPVAGRPILQRMLEQLDELGVAKVTIVVGYLQDRIRQFVSEWMDAAPRGLQVDLVRNERYAESGSVRSLDLALRAHASSRRRRHLLLIEGDVVVSPDLLGALLAAPAVTAATLLAPYTPDLSGTFATLEHGEVSAWLHESVRPPDFPLQRGFKTVNLTLFPRGEPRVRLDEAVRRVISDRGEKAPLEYAMQDLVQQGLRITGVLTEELPWFEVDTPEDLAIAHGLFAAPDLHAPV